MLKQVKLNHLDDYFTGLGERGQRGVYFYRINGYNQQIHGFIRRYYEAARRSGVVIEGKLQNPDSRQLAYYEEIMGMDFRLDPGFLSARLKKWLPRMSDPQRGNVSESIYSTLLSLRQAGKNDNMLKNAYIKFMCWLYYRFEQVVGRLGQEQLPKILYEGSIGSYELLLLRVLSTAGCDIVLLQYQGDAAYLRTDPGSAWSNALELPGLEAFPPAFSLKQIRGEIQEEADSQRLYGKKPQYGNCTNAWLSGNVLEDIRRDTGARGSDPAFFYNCFCRLMGVEDKLTYENELFQLQQELKNAGRKLVIVSSAIDPPTPEEVGGIQRKNYPNHHQMIAGLTANIRWAGSQELQRIMTKAFVDVMLEEEKRDGGGPPGRLMNRAVYLLCWLKRYQQRLFAGWKMPEVACFFYMGGCRNDSEALFCRFLARLPVDVLIFNPNLNQKCCLKDRLLYETNAPLSLTVRAYPEEGAELRAGTAGYHAEQELDTLMYQDSGLYRDQQYRKANAISLQTMYEEIAILWDQELKYRPNFSTAGDAVNIPVIFAKVCGVKNGDLRGYWSAVKNLITPDTLLIRSVPHLTAVSENPMKPYATEFFRNGRLQRERIKTHKAYRYSFLREPIQEYLLDKLQLLIEQRRIRGTFENGTEYTIVSTVLNLDKATLRLLQKFDFTKKNPKLIYISTGEATLSIEDTIYVAFLNLAGFDVLFFVPTGYQSVERYFNKGLPEEHQLGTYLYDLQAPDFNTVPSNPHPSWRDKLFRRGT